MTSTGLVGILIGVPLNKNHFDIGAYIHSIILNEITNLFTTTSLGSFLTNFLGNSSQGFSVTINFLVKRLVHFVKGKMRGVKKGPCTCRTFTVYSLTNNGTGPQACLSPFSVMLYNHSSGQFGTCTHLGTF